MKKEFFDFDSAFKGKKIHTVIYQPEIALSEIKGLVQIIHGFAEHIERYDSFMKLLTENGYIVFGDDHLGHGRTAKNNDMALTDVGSYDAFDYMLKDEWQLNQLMRQRFAHQEPLSPSDENQRSNPSLPCYILGHSMGSLMLRALLIQYPNICDRAIIMGTGDNKPALLSVFKLILNINKLFHKGDHISKFINTLGIDNNNSKFKDENSPSAWLSVNSDNVKTYTKDSLSGHPGSLHTFCFLCLLMIFIRKKENLEKMNKDMPILMLSGQEDAFGDFGKGPKIVHDLFKEAGMKDVKLITYPNMRHEILNEKDNQIVVHDILDFIANSN